MFAAWGLTDRGVVREENQDTFQVEMFSGETVLGVVCDGMGGARAGGTASRIALDTFCAAVSQFLSETQTSDGAQALLGEAAACANEAVYLRAQEDRSCAGMGTTMVAALTDGGGAHILNIGDSRAYRVGPEGIVRLTRDHSLVEDLVERGDLTPEEASRHPQKNLITRALGIEQSVKPDFFRCALAEGETLLLCSDGLINAATEQEILYELIHSGPREQACRRLVELALRHGAPDNVTAVIICA